ncbi:transcription elongation factor A N-terminal and central domain-containing protein [Bombina bombina]|uniref:transcription elongation factor A N-terminal and central domain-containing protein n=1 Tax=Bombina bombina TaxID=8345 RepID=UPI00235AF625|nr:transcription elongation factor A N-terminal and central domain-containing protein [Bombina bombina]
MVEETDMKAFIARAFQVESLLPERKYDDIAFHLAYFESIEVTVEMLQHTDIVRVVYRVLKSSPEGALKKKAKCLLSKWKALLRNKCLHVNTEQEHGYMDKDRSENTGAAPGKHVHCEKEVLVLSGISSSNCTESHNPQSLNNSQESHCNNSESVQDSLCQKNKKVVDVSLRTKCTDLLGKALEDPTECQDKAHNIARQIEESIYALYSENEKKYRTCIRSKVSNLKNPKNSHLRKDIFSGALSSEAFAKMNAMDMACEELRKIRANYTNACVHEHQLPKTMDGLQTNKIKCRRCEQFNCTVTMISRGTLFLPGWVRTGNPDEEMMTFVTCNECGEKWYHSRWICL